jgi:hypothetical protein
MARVLTGQRRQQLYSGRKAAETNEALLDTAGATSLNTRDTEVASPYPATVGMARVLTGQRRQQLYSGRKAAGTNEALLGTAGTKSLNTRDTEVAGPYPATGWSVVDPAARTTAEEEVMSGCYTGSPRGVGRASAGGQG